MNDVWLKRTVNYEEAENIEKPPENKTLISGPKTFPFPTRFLVVVGSGTHSKLERFPVSSSPIFAPLLQTQNQSISKIMTT